MATVTVTIDGVDDDAPIGNPITIEAESIANVTGYRLENKAVASGGQMLSLLGQGGGEVGTATFSFNGPSGDYNVIIGTFDESDGNASIDFLQDNSLINTIKIVASSLLITPGTKVNVLNNDTDADGNILTVTSINTSGTLGQVTNNGNGTVSYNPNGQFDELNTGDSVIDSFTYTVSDGNGGSDTATVNITINGVDDAGPGGGTPITVEAESIDTLANSSVSGYRTETKAVASGGAMLSLVSGAKNEVGTVTLFVDDITGFVSEEIYDISLGTFNESDGQASFMLELFRDDSTSQLGEIVLDGPSSSGLANVTTKVTLSIADGVTLQSGDILTVKGNENLNEHARLDFIELTPDLL